MYVNRDTDRTTVVAIYVDDLVIAATSKTRLNGLETAFRNR